MQKRTAHFPIAMLSVCISLLFLIGLLFGALRHCLTKTNIFEEIYAEIGNAPQMGMSLEDLVLASKQMMAYMEGQSESIDVTVTVDGQSTEMFNDRERMHMVDVRTLYQGWRAAYYTFMALFAGLVAFSIYYWKKESPFRLAGYFLYASGLLLLLALLLGSWILFDFNSFWTYFHLLFFSNDLWILDPLTSRMINMMPLELFFGIVLSMAKRFLTTWAILCGLCGAALLYRRLGWNKPSPGKTT